MLDEPIDPEFRAMAVGDQSAEAAFVRSGGREYRGQTLRPFSAMRFAAAQRMGLRFGTLDADETGPDGTYPGMIADAIMVVYLCAAPDSTVMKAFRAPDRVMAEAMAWAERNGASYGNAEMIEICQIFGEFIADVIASTAKPRIGSERAEQGN